MENFLEGCAPLRHWYIHPNVQSRIKKEHHFEENAPTKYKCKTSVCLLTEIYLQSSK